MHVLRHMEPDFARQLRAVSASSSLFDPSIEQRTRAILDEVRERGDAALVELTERFDGARLSPNQLAVSQAELVTAFLKAEGNVREAVAAAEKNIVAFAKKSLSRNWQMRNSHGATVGEKFDPLQRVGVYIPGGTAPLVSTVLMTITLAKVAGCRQIVACTPCARDGSLNPALLFAARVAGATEIYRIGGAQAIAAMAYGTSTIRRVQKIFGPGNAYVVAAKRLVFGHVAIDLLPGPSELLVLADETADPHFIAADLLAQAEHGSGFERVWLVTPSAKILKSVEQELGQQLERTPRRDLARKALENAFLIQVKNLEDAIALANELAPEHCELMTRQPRKILNRIVTAGAIFVGPWSPTVLGDYVAGPSHTLPTGGAGVAFSGLTVDQFQRRTSFVEYNRTALKRALPVVRKFAEMEGLAAHGKSAEARFGK